MDWQTIAGLLALGAATGFAAGLLGIGGGMLLVPFLTFIFTLRDFPTEHVVHMAIATSLATILFTSISSVRAHHQRGAVQWKVVKVLAPGILLGSLIGAQIAGRLPTFWIALVFAVFVGASAFQMLRDRKPKPSRELPGASGMFAVGNGIGFISSLVGAGGGFISVPFMIWSNVPMHQAVATSSALGFPIAAAGTIGYIIAGRDVAGLPAYSAGFIYLPALLAV
ncbi:MAG: sulfite exporter TauE/SafE family protein, partial [Burkholderiaceae bacterium]